MNECVVMLVDGNHHEDGRNKTEAQENKRKELICFRGFSIQPLAMEEFVGMEGCNLK